MAESYWSWLAVDGLVPGVDGLAFSVYRPPGVKPATRYGNRETDPSDGRSGTELSVFTSSHLVCDDRSHRLAGTGFLFPAWRLSRGCDVVVPGCNTGGEIRWECGSSGITGVAVCRRALGPWGPKMSFNSSKVQDKLRSGSRSLVSEASACLGTRVSWVESRRDGRMPASEDDFVDREPASERPRR